MDTTFSPLLQEAAVFTYGSFIPEMLHASQSQSCQLYMLPLRFRVLGALAAPKGSRYLAAFDHHLRKVAEGGVWKRIAIDAGISSYSVDTGRTEEEVCSPRAAEEGEEGEDDDHQSVEIGSVEVFFALLGFGLAAAVAAAAAEYAVHKVDGGKGREAESENCYASS